MTYPLCKDCRLFTSAGNCRKFRYTDVVHGGVKNYNAYVARMAENLCSLNGKHFIPKEPVVNSSPMIMCSGEGCGVIVDIDLVDMMDNTRTYLGMSSSDDEST